MLIEKLQAQSGLSKAELHTISGTASKRYKIYNIAKRGGGVREIAHPSASLKAVQRWISKVLISDLPVHPCAAAYRKGSNIRANALKHAKSKFTLRMDFENFFPSFSSEKICLFLSAKDSQLNWQLSKADLKFVTSILTRYGTLTIGAPSSPALTNAMMYEFDESVFSLARDYGLIYTRYADDLFISSPEPGRLVGMCHQVTAISERFPHAGLIVNKKKTAYLSRRYRRSITGLLITPDGRVSIGRARKREIKALVHQYLDGSLAIEDVEYLRGLVAFTMDADPLFYEALCSKYGLDNMFQLRRLHSYLQAE